MSAALNVLKRKPLQTLGDVDLDCESKLQTCYPQDTPLRPFNLRNGNPVSKKQRREDMPMSKTPCIVSDALVILVWPASAGQSGLVPVKSTSVILKVVPHAAAH